ncbi:MAG: sialidase family protein [Rhodocyclales bacterium]|nr:sialidase family protein [Rhodocyclales bacterium]
MQTRLIVLSAMFLGGLYPPGAMAQEGHEAHAATTDSRAGKKAAPHVRSALGVGVAIAPNGELWLVGLNPESRLFTQSSKDLGVTWNELRVLDIGGDKVSADGENRPKIAFGPKQQVVISYTQPLAKPNTGEIRMLRSGDGGKTFSAPVTIHRDRQVITHRFESLAFDRSGLLHTVWIDKRDLVLAMSKAGESSGKSSAYAGAAIYRNESHDGGLSFGPDIKVADHSCECCRIALAPTPEGGVAAIWRHVFAPNIRDHAFAVLGDAAKAPVRASFDNWRLDGCPHHGPSLAPSAQGGYHAVWFGEKAGRAAVRHGRLAADGTPQGAVQELPDPRAEHADIATFGKQVVIAWRSYDGVQTQLRAWLSADDGAHFVLRELAASKEQNDFPRLLVTTEGIRVLWRTAKEIHVLPILP